LNECDLVIVGGGLVGGSLACVLSKPHVELMACFRLQYRHGFGRLICIAGGKRGPYASELWVPPRLAF